jgi:vacuolar fusion protein MON1
MMKALVGAITKGTTEYVVGDLSIPGLRHFLYKSRPQVQVTAPAYEDPYDDANERRRCVPSWRRLPMLNYYRCVS